MRSPLSALFAQLAVTRAALEELLGHGDLPAEETAAELRRCGAAIQACLAWKGANDRERSVRSAIDNTLRSCLDAMRMADLGLTRNRRDMVESSSRNLAHAHERLLAIARVLEE